MGMSVFNQRPAKTVSKDPGMVVEGGLFGGPGRRNSYYGQGEQEQEGGSGKEPHDSSSHDSPLNAKKFFNPEDVEETTGDEYSTGEELPPLSPDWDEPL
ncbi:hypothetical protein HOH45_01890 [bacterium]|jgi:hypothetical protein|nr:hypothetical protein [bacterium]